MTLKATVKASELQKLFRELGDRAQNLRPAMRKIGGVLERASEVAFQRQGPGWKPLTSKYKQRKAKKFGGGKKILELEGNLASSVSAQLVGDRAVFVGSNLEYARAHNQGSPKQGIPKREFLIVSQAETRKAIFILSKHLLRNI